MYNFDRVELNISKNYVLSKLSEEEIFKKYIVGFKEIDVKFCSELRREKTASVNITNRFGRLFYKDFGDGSSFDCFSYIQKKFNCTFFESLNIISADFSLSKINYKPKDVIIANDIIKLPKIKAKTEIEIIKQGFTLSDFNYWNSYNIPLSLLSEYDISSVKWLCFIKNNKRFILEYKKNNPIFSYEFKTFDRTSYKIYKPLDEKSRKWLFLNGSKEDIEGYSQLPLNGNLLFLTKSMKDVLILKLLGFSAISLQGEHNPLSFELYTKLTKRFDSIISLYDNDLAGEKGANYLYNTYQIPYIFIPKETNCKDISDFAKLNNLEESKILIDSLI